MAKPKKKKKESTGPDILIKRCPHCGKSLIDDELRAKDFRVVVFGSARLKPGTPAYTEVYELGLEIGHMGADIVTGGGPGLMEAANRGHMAGKLHGDEHSIGIGIELPFEESFNKHLDITDQHEHFSSRLDLFMRLSNAVVVAPGGIGTMLELAYAWQLMQVGHMCKVPLILMGDMWEDLIEWVKKNPLKKGLMSPDDMDFVYLVKNHMEAIEILKKTMNMYEDGEYDACLNWDKYNIN